MSIAKPIRLVSFVGTTDGQLAPEGKGPILTAVKAMKPTEVVLLVTEGVSDRFDYQQYAALLKRAIQKLAPQVRVSRRTMVLDDPTDHNAIYPLLKGAVEREVSEDFDLVAAISSGTPSMQVCWILLAESGEAPLKLVRTVDPSLTKNVLRPVSLGVGLPRIVALEQENQALKQAVLETVTVHLKEARIYIGSTLIELSPRQFTYYLFFLDRAKRAAKPDGRRLRVTGVFVDEKFSSAIVRYHEAAYPESEDLEIVKMRQNNLNVESSVFRTNVSKTNTKIRKALRNTPIAKYYEIRAMGPKNARQYSVELEALKVQIITK